MKIVSALFSIGCFIPLVFKVEGQRSLRAPSQALRSLPKHLVPVAMPLIEKDLDHRKLAISQQCATDTLALYESVEYTTAFDAWRSERGTTERDCVVNGNTLECSVDSKTLASHDNLVSVCENAGGLSYLYTYSAVCDYTFDDSSSGVVAFNEIDVPECVASSCTVEELDELATSIAERLADINEESLLGLTQVISATCTESDPIGNPTGQPDDQQCIADMNAFYSTPPLSSVWATWLSEYRADIETGCTGSCVFDSKDYDSHDDLLAACERAGGISFLFSDSLFCEGTDSTTRYTLEVHLIDHPQCIATSCNTDEHIERLDTTLDELGQSLEAASQISNYECISTDSVVSGLDLPTTGTTPSPPTPSPPTPSPPTSSPLPAACGAQCKAPGASCFIGAIGINCCCAPSTCVGVINPTCQ